MAPNRRSIEDLHQVLTPQDLTAIQNSITTTEPIKFLPLTQIQKLKEAAAPGVVVNPQEAQTTQVDEEATVVSNTNNATTDGDDSHLYWKWNASVDASTDNVKIDFFSAERIQANAIQYAARFQATESQQVATHDDYWFVSNEQVFDEINEQPVRTALHEDVDYWAWPADQDVHQATIRRILADEWAREQTSVDAIEQMELKAATASSSCINSSHKNASYWCWESPKVASHAMDPTHPNASYWDWESPSPMKEETTCLILQGILEYEQARERCTAETIVRNLVHALVPSAPLGVTTTKASSDDYWLFAEQYGDEYRQATTTASITITMSSQEQGYWDW